MDDLTIEIDELILGATPPAEEAVSAAMRERVGERLGARVVAESSRAIVRSLSELFPEHRQES